MEKPEETLLRWRRIEPCRLNCSDVGTHPALQPRDPRIVAVRDRHRLEDQSREHVAILRQRLSVSGSADLEPILVSVAEGLSSVVDGHHRLAAYQAEGRRTIPARVLETNWSSALLVSKLVNLDGAKLPMHAEQRRDAAWQYLSEVTRRGSEKLPRGESLRIIAGRFGIAHSTVSAMLQRLPEVRLEEFPPDALDPGTQWPRWRYLRQSEWKGGLEAMAPEAKLKWQAERLARQLARLIDGKEPDVVALAVKFLALETPEASALELLFEESSDF